MKKPNRHKKARAHHKMGLPPGTLVYSGPEQEKPATLHLISFNNEEFYENKFTDTQACLQAFKPNCINWLNLDGIHDVEKVEAIGKALNIHPLTLEDIVHITQRPKFEEYENYVAAFLKMLSFNECLLTEQLTIVLQERTIVSFQEVEGGDAFELVRKRIRQGNNRLRKSEADYLMYALIDAVVDSYFHVLSKIGDNLEIVENTLLGNPEKKTLHELHELKRQMIHLRKCAWPLRDLVSNMQRSDSALIQESTQLYLRDVQDHAIRVIETIEANRDVLASMMDIYLTGVSNRMNEVMKVLTIISTIFIPVTFIVGVYGMNFDYMPELHSRNGYYATWAVMIIIMFLMVLYFRKKKWL